MHESSGRINQFSEKNAAKIKAEIIYPEASQSFWNLVIGLGYPTPEPPGFRWCTERLKIQPMNKFTNDIISQYGEVVLLLGVRKAESLTRKRSITSREIEGKLLVPHSDISKAYVYNPLTEIANELVWEYLLKNDGISTWGVDMKYLFSLYQGEDLGEEQSVVGQIDKDKIPVTGNSRFGCWCCTIVKVDKSLQRFIDNGSKELEPLKKFRDWLVSIRQDPEFRDNKRRNGKVYQKANGECEFYEVELGTHTHDEFSKKCNKLLKITSNINIVSKNRDRITRILVPQIEWWIKKVGIGVLRGIGEKVTMYSIVDLARGKPTYRLDLNTGKMVCCFKPEKEENG